MSHARRRRREGWCLLHRRLHLGPGPFSHSAPRQSPAGRKLQTFRWVQPCVALLMPHDLTYLSSLPSPPQPGSCRLTESLERRPRHERCTASCNPSRGPLPAHFLQLPIAVVHAGPFCGADDGENSRCRWGKRKANLLPVSLINLPFSSFHISRKTDVQAIFAPQISQYGLAERRSRRRHTNL